MEIPRHWRLKGQRYSLTGTTCTECGKRFFTPRMVCDVCSAAVSNEYRFEEKRFNHTAESFEVAQR